MAARQMTDDLPRCASCGEPLCALAGETTHCLACIYVDESELSEYELDDPYLDVDDEIPW